MFEILPVLLFLLPGLCLISLRPIVFRFNRVKNVCTRETCFIWQDHSTKKLCDLNDIRSVQKKRDRRCLFHRSRARYYIILQLKNKAEITLSPYNKNFSYQDFLNINNFLANTEKNQHELVFKDRTHIYIGIAFIVCSVLLCFSF